jgi:hypothetical protein
MMGRLKREQEQLFYSFCLDEAVPNDHRVRAIAGRCQRLRVWSVRGFARLLPFRWNNPQKASCRSRRKRGSDPVQASQMEPEQ